MPRARHRPQAAGFSLRLTTDHEVMHRELWGFAEGSLQGSLPWRSSS